MKKIIVPLIIVSFSLSSTTLAAAPTPAPTMARKCDSLKSQWKGLEQGLADREAGGIADNSAPRATLRATEDSNDLAKAQIILTLLQANKCPLPSSAPSYITYFSDALACRTELLKGVKDSPKCDRSVWKALVEW